MYISQFFIVSSSKELKDNQRAALKQTAPLIVSSSKELKVYKEGTEEMFASIVSSSKELKVVLPVRPHGDRELGFILKGIERIS